MNLVPWRKKEESLDHWFDDFFGSPFRVLERVMPEARTWNPSIDIAESDTEITVRAELPGVDPKDVEISLEGNVLTVSGEKSEKKEEKSENYHWAERTFGSFRRTVHLPETIDPEKVTADYDKGVLEIRIAKSEAAKPRKIDIKTK